MFVCVGVDALGSACAGYALTGGGLGVARVLALWYKDTRGDAGCIAEPASSAGTRPPARHNALQRLRAAASPERPHRRTQTPTSLPTLTQSHRASTHTRKDMYTPIPAHTCGTVAQCGTPWHMSPAAPEAAFRPEAARPGHSPAGGPQACPCPDPPHTATACWESLPIVAWV